MVDIWLCAKVILTVFWDLSTSQKRAVRDDNVAVAMILELKLHKQFESKIVLAQSKCVRSLKYPCIAGYHGRHVAKSLNYPYPCPTRDSRNGTLIVTFDKLLHVRVTKAPLVSALSVQSRILPRRPFARRNTTNKNGEGCCGPFDGSFHVVFDALSWKDDWRNIASGFERQGHQRGYQERNRNYFGETTNTRFSPCFVQADLREGLVTSCTRYRVSHSDGNRTWG